MLGEITTVTKIKKTIHQKIIFERNNFAKNDLHTP